MPHHLLYKNHTGNRTHYQAHHEKVTIKNTGDARTIGVVCITKDRHSSRQKCLMAGKGWGITGGSKPPDTARTLPWIATISKQEKSLQEEEPRVRHKYIQDTKDG
jgi:hypothetical protein